MFRSLVSSAFLLATTIYAGADENYPASSREDTEWCQIWIPRVLDKKLPRVLLIGDSITVGYGPQVEKRMAGKANVAYIGASGFLADPLLLAQIAAVLDSMKFDVVHFNNGMHGWHHTEQNYRQAFPGFLATIRKHAPNARLVWAATTPVKGDQPVKMGELQVSNERVVARNAIALELIGPLGLPVNDLYTLMAGKPESYKDDVHFTADAVARQADHITALLEPLLKP